jgi:hypothetical protein
MPKIDLPDGGWAQLAEPEELTNRQRKMLRRSVAPVLDSDGGPPLRDRILEAGVDPKDEATWVKAAGLLSAADLEAVDDIQAAFIVAYVREWSLDLPLPTMETVDDLPGPIFDALSEATRGLGTGEPDLSVSKDPDSPTVPSSGTST